MMEIGSFSLVNAHSAYHSKAFEAKPSKHVTLPDKPPQKLKIHETFGFFKKKI